MDVSGGIGLEANCWGEGKRRFFKWVIRGKIEWMHYLICITCDGYVAQSAQTYKRFSWAISIQAVY